MAKRHGEATRWRRMPGPMRFAFFTAAVVMTGFVGALVWTEWRHPPDIIQRSPTSSRLLAIGLPALPEGRLVRAREVVEAVYEFAARHPDVLRDVPCFCGRATGPSLESGLLRGSAGAGPAGHLERTWHGLNDVRGHRA